MKRLLFITPLFLALGLVLMRCDGQDPVATDTTKDNPSASAKAGNQAKGKLGNRIESCTGSIGDFVWLDLNGNGKWDTGEPGLPGVKITLTLYGIGTFVAETTTDVNGNYVFTGLCPNTYAVTYTPPTGLCQPSGVCWNLTDATSNNYFHCNGVPVTLGDGETNANIDFGFTVCGTNNLGL